MRQTILTIFATILLVSSGCYQEAAVITAPDPVTSKPALSETKTVSSAISDTSVSNQEQSDETEDDGGLLGRAKSLLKDAADSGSKEAGAAQKWMSDKFGDATDSGSQIADDAAKWASEAFESLRDKGLTTADSASDWVTEDIRNMNALKYKIVKISMDDLEAVEDQLNDLGKLRWDCFHAVAKDGETILFFKKERRSILKNIPLKDMLKLVPLMGDGAGQ